MAIKRFEDFIAWQKAQNLAVEIYNHFKNSKDFGFRDQICRATVSISNNITEVLTGLATQILNGSFIYTELKNLESELPNQ